MKNQIVLFMGKISHKFADNWNNDVVMTGYKLATKILKTG